LGEIKKKKKDDDGRDRFAERLVRHSEHRDLHATDDKGGHPNSGAKQILALRITLLYCIR